MDGAMKQFFSRFAFAGLVCAALAGTALASEASSSRDPYEGFNRAMFAVHETLDNYAVRPAAQAYDAAVPLPVKASVGNLFGTVGELWVGGNNVLQGKFVDAGNDFSRLLINATVGIFGLFDVASELGLERHNEDFGQTLAVWGVKDGGYLFWPLIGPKTVRDTAGWGVDTVADPFSYLEPVRLKNSMRLVRVLDVRAGLLPADKIVEEAALDKYAYIRDAYLQRRRHQIYDGYPPRLDD